MPNTLLCHSTPQSFLVFGDQICPFVAAFTQASMYSIWRSLHNKFVFSYVAQKLPMSCFQDYFFQGKRTENT